MAPRSLRAGATLLAATLGLGALALGPQAAASAEDDLAYLYTVPASAAAQIQDLDIVTSEGSSLVVLGDSHTRTLLGERGISITRSGTYAESLGAAPAARSSLARAAAPAYPLPERLAGTEYETYFGGYRTVASYERFAADVAAAYPELAQRVDYGDSWLKTQGRGGHDLIALRLTAGVQSAPSWTDGQEGKPRFVLIGQTHAREVIAGEFAWRYATELLNGYGTDPEATSLLDSTEVWVILTHNPDGVELAQAGLSDPNLVVNAAGDAAPAATSTAWQRKNANDTDFVQTSTRWNSVQPGVDLNRNWGTDWGGVNTSAIPTSLTYKGTAAHSEPEVYHLEALLKNLFGTYRVGETTRAPDTRTGTFVTLHSSSNYVIYPYAYNKTAPVPNLDALVASGFRQSLSNGYQTGKAGEILYNNAGNDIDWIYSELGIPAFTYEIGNGDTGGFYPGYGRAEALWSVNRPAVNVAAHAARAPYTAPLGSTITELTAERDADLSISVSGAASDDTYGTAAASAARRPAVRDITAVEAAVAADSSRIGSTVALSVEGEGPSVTFSGSLPAEATTAAHTRVFTRAQNSSGHWGPWRAAFVEAAPRAGVSLTLSTLTPKAGETISATVSGVDALGTVREDLTASAVLTSSVDSDVIVGNTVTFPTASPHVITATVGEFSASVTVQVTAASVVDTPGSTPPAEAVTNPAVGAGDKPRPALSATGAAPGLAAGLAALLLAAGAALLVRRRLRA
ncbi:M14 family zinc carboxypeptidase [Mycetocola spongiae]|uniref:M14 family zinc carboxypeptidase n=1 Tax=Mycetocola spongiae TaxID=2859226 RepID=UPI001CF599FA|nr:M14 family zinc carboxypeptidase [Mycetocola spongiae]UCR88702.1 hypothetical protein KXZ72_12170 [Mycetocola spongiae]